MGQQQGLMRAEREIVGALEGDGRDRLAVEFAEWIEGGEFPGCRWYDRLVGLLDRIAPACVRFEV